MTNDQHLETRQVVAKRRVPLISKQRVPFFITVLAGVGVIDLIRAWHKHDLKDMLVVVLVCFVVTPMLVVWISKHDWTR
jgi:hypothetical protein